MASGEIILLNKTPKLTPAEIRLPASKSESNRALIIAALAQGDSKLENLSEARDTGIMQSLIASESDQWDARDAGTTFRFLTAYAALKRDATILTGTQRMQQRPIEILAGALNQLGAEITFLGKNGYPPLRIERIIKQKTDQVTIKGNVSSQYISALMMIAPNLERGLRINFEGKVTSLPYLKMTTSIMEIFGAKVYWESDHVIVKPIAYHPAEFSVESDWSAASYWYSMVSMAESASIELIGLKEKSYQGDQAIVSIMEQLGVKSQFSNKGVRLEKTDAIVSHFTHDFAHCPDLTQTVLVICAARKVRCTITGLESLKIKETDRILALQNELAKIGATLREEGSTWYLEPPANAIDWSQPLRFESYEDHRMAMSFAPLCTLGNVRIEDPEVVKKSYPGFWKDLQIAGVKVN